jgi:hypothetical protein
VDARDKRGHDESNIATIGMSHPNLSASRSVQWPEPAFHRTGQQQFHQSFVAPPPLPLEPVFAAIETLDVELLASLNAVLFPDLGRRSDLSMKSWSSCQVRYRLRWPR